MIGFEESILIQAKRYGPTKTVGSPDIQQYASLKNQFGVDMVLIITTNDFMESAIKTADQLYVKLINGIQLAGLVMNIDAFDLVVRYIPEVEALLDPPEPEPELTSVADVDPDLTVTDRPTYRSESSSVDPEFKVRNETRSDRNDQKDVIEDRTRDSMDSYKNVVEDENPDHTDDHRDVTEPDLEYANVETANSDGVTIPETTLEDNTTESKTDVTPPHRWVRNMSVTWIIAFMGTVIGVAGGSSFFTGVAGLVLIVAYLGLPVALFADRDGPSFGWRFVYVISALIVPPIAGGWYLIRCSDYEQK